MQRAHVGVIVAWLLALICVLAPSAERLAQAAADDALDAELVSLERVAGLASASDPLPVRIEVDGPPWATDAARAVAARHPSFAPADGPHRLTASVGAEANTLVVRWSLERRGWAIHAPDATTRRLLPALAIVPLLLGLAIWWRVGRAAPVAVGVALVVQALAAWWPWPAAIPRPPSLTAESSVVAAIVDWAGAMDDRGVAIAAGVIALCAVLAWFDHRRSKGSTRIATPLVVIVSAVAWLEAAVRLGGGAWATTAWGLVGIAAQLGGLAVVVQGRRRSVAA